MIPVQNVKVVSLEPASFSNGATGTLQVDTTGFDYATFFIQLGRTNTVSNVPSVLKLQSADVTNVSSFADISGSSFTSSYTAGLTNAVQTLEIGVDLKAQKRYVQLVASPVTTQVLAATCILSRPEQSPWNATLAGTAAAPIFL